MATASTPRFSIVIPCLTTERTLNRCLASIASQTIDLAQVEVIVVDDASEPPLEATALEWASSLAAGGCRLVYNRNDSNRGRASTRNVGLRESKGCIIFFLDVDQVLDSGCLTVLDKEFPDSSPRSVRANISVPPDLCARSAYVRFYNSRFLGQRPLRETQSLDMRHLPPKFFATGSLAVSRSALELGGNFDESFSEYGCEDEEMGIRFDGFEIPLQMSADTYVYDSDDGLSLERACKRYISYGQYSLPNLIAKHPRYASIIGLGLFECPVAELSFMSRLKRTILFYGFRPWMAITLRRLLILLDHVPPRFDPPASLFQLAFVGHYLIGYRKRARLG